MGKDPLQTEVEKTVRFFVEIDLKNEGRVTDSTKEAARVQGVDIDSFGLTLTSAEEAELRERWDLGELFYSPVKAHDLLRQEHTFSTGKMVRFRTYPNHNNACHLMIL